MTRHSWQRRRAGLAGSACLLLSAAAGCAGDPAARAGRPATQGVRVEVQDERESMTPAQRGARYRAAYEHGLGLVRAGDYAQALGAFEEAARLRPESADAVFNLAACHEAVGDPMRAISFYRRLLEQHPDDPDCHANLGTSFIKMYYREGTPAWKKMAREAWLRSLQLKPDQPDVRAHLERISQPE